MKYPKKTLEEVQEELIARYEKKSEEIEEIVRTKRAVNALDAAKLVPTYQSFTTRINARRKDIEEKYAAGIGEIEQRKRALSEIRQACNPDALERIVGETRPEQLAEDTRKIARMKARAETLKRFSSHVGEQEQIGISSQQRAIENRRQRILYGLNEEESRLKRERLELAKQGVLNHIAPYHHYGSFILYHLVKDPDVRPRQLRQAIERMPYLLRDGGQELKTETREGTYGAVLKTRCTTEDEELKAKGFTVHKEISGKYLATKDVAVRIAGKDATVIVDGLCITSSDENPEERTRILYAGREFPLPKGRSSNEILEGIIGGWTDNENITPMTVKDLAGTYRKLSIIADYLQKENEAFKKSLAEQ